MGEFKLEKEPKLLNASELLDLMAASGVGHLSVRIHSKDGTVKNGRTSWHDDRINGAAVVIHNSETGDDEGLVPLGGEIFYFNPPKISSFESARKIPFLHGEEMGAKKRPINPIAQGYSFEIIEE